MYFLNRRILTISLGTRVGVVVLCVIGFFVLQIRFLPRSYSERFAVTVFLDRPVLACLYGTWGVSLRLVGARVYMLLVRCVSKLKMVRL